MCSVLLKKNGNIMIFLVLLALTACMGSRGYIGEQKACENDYLQSVISLSELFSPCNK